MQISGATRQRRQPRIHAPCRGMASRGGSAGICRQRGGARATGLPGCSKRIAGIRGGIRRHPGVLAGVATNAVQAMTVGRVVPGSARLRLGAAPAQAPPLRRLEPCRAAPSCWLDDARSPGAREPSYWRAAQATDQDRMPALARAYFAGAVPVCCATRCATVSTNIERMWRSAGGNPAPNPSQ